MFFESRLKWFSDNYYCATLSFNTYAVNTIDTNTERRGYIAKEPRINLHAYDNRDIRFRYQPVSDSSLEFIT